MLFPLTTVLGAEITGVGLTPDLDDLVVARMRAALLDHKVVFLRNQSLDPASLAGVARRFGEPTEAHPVEPSVEGHPEVLSLDANEGARADVWHSDLTFQPRPPMGAMLHARVVPAVGGDTLWSDMAATYTALSPAIRVFLETLTATHTPAKASGYFAQRDPDGQRATAAAAAPDAHTWPRSRLRDIRHRRGLRLHLELPQIGNCHCSGAALQHPRQIGSHGHGAKRRSVFLRDRAERAIQPAILGRFHAGRAGLHVILGIKVRTRGIRRPGGLHNRQLVFLKERHERREAWV